MEEYIKVDIKEGYAVVEFYHPAHNSLHSGMLKQLKEELEGLEKETKVKCILLKSGGDRTFCAGANFDEMKAIKGIEDGRKFFSGFAGVIMAMKNSSKLIVGRIQGKAVGGGVGLIAACDIALGTKYASIRLSELSIGIGPFVIAPVVERKIGLSAFSELTLHPKEWLEADLAKEKGLYANVFDTTDDLDRYIESYLTELSSYSKRAIAENKKMLWHNTDDFESIMAQRAEISGALVLDLDL